MNTLETKLVEAVVYNYIQTTRQLPFSTGETTQLPPINPDEFCTAINDQIKTFLRIKADCKHIADKKFAVVYKDTYKNTNTLYVEVY